jgi:hypothetical protein
MKPAFSKIIAPVIFLALLLIIFSCNKNNDALNGPAPQPANRAPVAIAGNDRVLNITNCSSLRSVALDGTLSYDPDIGKLKYRWTKIAGPDCILTDTTNAIARASNLVSGLYAFELKVLDSFQSTGKDTITVTVSGSPLPIEVNMDAALSVNFGFSENHFDCYLPFFVSPYCYYYDLFTAVGSFDLTPIGAITFTIHEETDTTYLSSVHHTDMYLNCSGCAPSMNLEGSSSINFKNLMRQGGGPFSGTLQVENGTAKGCDQNIFTNLNPLIITGTMDTAMHTMNLTIRGKVYF